MINVKMPLQFGGGPIQVEGVHEMNWRGVISSGGGA